MEEALSAMTCLVQEVLEANNSLRQLVASVSTGSLQTKRGVRIASMVEATAYVGDGLHDIAEAIREHTHSLENLQDPRSELPEMGKKSVPPQNEPPNKLAGKGTPAVQCRCPRCVEE